MKKRVFYLICVLIIPLCCFLSCNMANETLESSTSTESISYDVETEVMSESSMTEINTSTVDNISDEQVFNSSEDHTIATTATTAAYVETTATATVTPEMTANVIATEAESTSSKSEAETTMASHQTAPQETTIESSISIEDVPCAIEYLFGSIADMETFIYTRSKRQEDYTFRPLVPLEDIPAVDLSKKYLPLASLLEIDEDKFVYHEASFKRTEDGGIEFWYYLDDVYIRIEKTGFSSATDVVRSDLSYGYHQGFSEYDSTLTTANGYFVRAAGKADIVYKLQNGIKKTAIVVVDGFKVTILNTAYSSDNTVAEDYQNFLKSDKTQSIAAFFDNDQTRFQTAMEKLQ